MSTEESSVFEFLSLRPVRQPDVSVAAQAIVHDDVIVPVDNTHTMVPSTLPGRFDVDLFGRNSPSSLCSELFQLVKSNKSLPALCASVERNLLRGYRGTIGNPSRPFGAALLSARMAASESKVLALLARRPYYVHDGFYFVLPGSIDDIPSPLHFALSAMRRELTELIEFIRASRLGKTPTPIPGVATHVPSDDTWPGLIDIVFSVETATYATDFAIAKRVCFDAYYGLYVLRKQEPLRLEPAIEALQVLHALERTASYLFFRYAAKVPADSNEGRRIDRLAQTLRQVYQIVNLAGRSGDELEKTLDEIALPIKANELPSSGPLSAQPMLHPLFLKLSLDWAPFNDLRPVGVGDLMVVKQKFLGYQKGEIAHIETILAGETKLSMHKRTERTETSQTYVSSEDTENTNDRQTTTRFELKREAETILKTEFSASLGAQLTYDSKPVVASVTASANLSLSRGDTTKLASNFARDITEKAVTHVQRRVSQQRSQTVIAETIEINRHKFENPAENDNVSGVYRWVDKVYKAEVRNYGRRLMFEILIPEPAAFFVQQRLLQYAASLDLPNYPLKDHPVDDSTVTSRPVPNAQGVTREKFVELNQMYMLDDMPPPPDRIDGIPIVNQSGGRIFTKTTSYNDTGMKYDNYWGCAFGTLAAGYVLDSIALSGTCRFRAKGETESKWINTLEIVLKDSQGDHVVFDQVNEDIVYWAFDGSQPQFPTGTIPSQFDALSIGTKTCDAYSLTILGSAKLSDAAFAAWQQKVYDALIPARKRKTDSQGAPVEDPDVAAFKAALAEIKKPDLIQLLQGRSSEWNEQVIKRELRRQGISQVSGEFGNDSTRQQLTTMESMGSLGVGNGYEYPTLSITPGNAKDTETKAIYERETFPTDGYYVPDVDLSRRKGLHIQFIEHAFEWEKLTYIFYPYYWSTPPRWVELLAREDNADAHFTDFLQAGAARVLLAVRPGFEQAVMHYLATREPWDGGSTPMIGDPLYLPVYLEIKERQDDYAGSARVGEPWTVTVPTSLVYLESPKFPLPSEFDPTKPLE